MIVVRNCFVAKPGMASKLAKLMKEVMEQAGVPVRVLTDVTGEFNRVVMEMELENLAAFEALNQRYMTDEDLRKKMAGYTDLYVTGSREILRVL